MGSTLIRVEISERRDAFIPKKERFNWVYAFFSSGRSDVPKNLQSKFWYEYLMPGFMDGFRLCNSSEEAIATAILRFEQEELTKVRSKFVDFCPGFSLICCAGSDGQNVAPLQLFQYGMSGCVCGDMGERNLFTNLSGNYPAVVGSRLLVSGPNAYIRLDTCEVLQEIQSITELSDLDVTFLEQPMFDLHTLNSDDANDYMKNLIEDGYMAEAMTLSGWMHSRYDVGMLKYLNDLNELLIDVKADGHQQYKALWETLKTDYPIYINNHVSRDVFTKGSFLYRELQKLMATPMGGLTAGYLSGGPHSVAAALSRPSGMASTPGMMGTMQPQQLSKIDQDYANTMQAIQIGNYMLAIGTLKAIKQAMATTNPTSFTLSDLNNQLLIAEEALHLDEVKTVLNSNDPKKANNLYNQYRLNDLVLKSQIDQALRQRHSGSQGFFEKYKYYLLGIGGFVLLFLIVLVVVMPILRESAIPITPQTSVKLNKIAEETTDEVQASPEGASKEQAIGSQQSPVNVTASTVKASSAKEASQPSSSSGSEVVNTSLGFEASLQQIASGKNQYIDYALKMCTSDAKVYVHASDDSYMEQGSMRSYLRQVSVKKSLGYQIEQVVREGNKVTQLILK